jgi:hypothetical protein
MEGVAEAAGEEEAAATAEHTRQRIPAFKGERRRQRPFPRSRKNLLIIISFGRSNSGEDVSEEEEDEEEEVERDMEEEEEVEEQELKIASVHDEKSSAQTAQGATRSMINEPNKLNSDDAKDFAAGDGDDDHVDSEVESELKIADG